MVITILLIAVVLVLGLLQLWNQFSNNYFKKCNVPFIPASVLGGELRDMILQRKAITDVLLKIYNDPRVKDAPVIGCRFLHKHVLVVKDLDLIKRILIKDFNYFSDRRTNSDPDTDILGGANMFMAKNPMWKSIRTKITPVFSTIKMKQFHNLINETGHDLHENLMRNIPTSKIMDVKDFVALFTTDNIASCAYGVKANSLKDPNSEFRRQGKEIFNFTTKRSVEFALLFFWPEVVPYLRIKLFNKDATHFLNSTLKYVMDEREKNNITRNDLIDILIGLRKADRDKAPSYSSSDLSFYDDILVAQAAVFFTAGFETTSSAISFTLYELAKQPDLQLRLRNEIKEFLERHNNQINYENIPELTYLNMVCQETFRMWPSLPYIDRECTPEDGADSYSLNPVIDYDVPRGFPIFIPTFALHRDERYYPNPFKYDPERFHPDNVHSIPHCAYIPFGLGPRNCLGERFGVMQVKLGLIHFFRSHRVEVCDKTMMDMQIHRLAMLVTPIAGIWLNVINIATD